VKHSASGLLVAVTLAASIAIAQDDQPAEGVAASESDAQAEAALRAERIRARRLRRAARRAEREARAAQIHAAEAADAAPQDTATAAHSLPGIDAAPPLATGTPGLDGGIDVGTALDALPVIAAVQETPKPAHQTPSQAAGEAAAAAAHGHETASAEHAEAAPGHAEHARFSVGTFALQLLNLGVLLFLLVYFGGRAMNKSLRARHEQLKRDLAEAARVRDEARRQLDGQERRLADLERELAALRTSMRQDAEREQARILQSAQERARKNQEEMRFQLDQQVKEAEMLLRAEVAGASVKLAEELLRKSVDALDQRRLAQEFVAGADSRATPSGEDG
jgi:F-type H+-transporting ATPase subunit b